MLYLIFINFGFRRFCQSGFYIDFFYKKLSEIFIRNIFVYAAQFFGEKYIIEVLTKKIFNKVISKISNIYGWTTLPIFNFFYNLLVILFYSVSFYNFILFFF